jgi:hypothetical protein
LERTKVMDQAPRLLSWNYSSDEQKRLEEILKELGAPPVVAIERNQGHLPLREIIHTGNCCGKDFDSEEKVVLFYNIPQKGVFLLINVFKQKELPPSIYAVVTEHSIKWAFSDLLEHLIEERNAMAARAMEKPKPTGT